MRERLSLRSRIWNVTKSLTSTVVFAWLFTQHVAQATVVPSGSMSPTIFVGDHFLMDKVAFPANYPQALQKFLPARTIKRGDILAFWSPVDPNTRLVKRVVGLPGETIEIRDENVYINGRKLDEPYAVHVAPHHDRFAVTRIPPDEFFMMGDNRDNSNDSRYWGFAHRKDLIGKPLFVYWSYDNPQYQSMQDWTIQDWAVYLGSLPTHFLTDTRWSRTGVILR